mmetsp:Transcript_53771/g.96325  ORF Transcript_53771/g.96325 Transcript_53771/m.96325 type:complete len:988 (-) Transcript_53771:151-3114(-)
MLPGAGHAPRKPTTPRTFRPHPKGKISDKKVPLRGSTLRVPHSRVKATPDIDPETWHPEVVRALSSRLPGGVSQVTVQCKLCKSVFYPCLCQEDDTRRVPHERGILPPKVVREAEQRRLSKMAMGHLDELQRTLDIKGMNKDACQILDSEVASLKTEVQSSERSALSRNILWREGHTYVVTDANAEPIRIELKFTGGELQDLSELVGEELWRFGGEGRKNQDRNRLTILSRAPFYPKERPDGEEEERNKHLAFLQATQPIEYRNPQEACGDLELFEFVTTKQETVWEVVEVKKGGTADKANIRQGFRLLQLELSVPNRTKAPWKVVNLEEGGLPPSCLMITDQRWGNDDEDFVPCRLTFTQLVPGAEVRKADDKPMSKDDLEVLMQEKEPVMLSLQWTLNERINRTETSIRHCHFLECQEDEKSNNESVPDRMKEELYLFEEWIVKHKVSAWALLYVFSKLLDAVKKEMTGFEKNRKERQEMLLAKSLRAVDIEQRLKDLEDSEDPVGPSDETRKQQLKKDLAQAKSEIRGTLDMVPPYFIQEAILEAGDMSDSGSPTLMRRNSALTAAKTATVEGKMGSRHSPHADPLREHQRKNQGVMGSDAASTARSSMENPTRNAARMADAKDAWDFLREEARLYQESLQDRATARAVSRKGPASVTLPPLDLTNEEDGRLSKKEFDKILMLSGVNWLSRTESGRLFESMDKDKSGKLNLGELLQYANRVTSLVRRMQAYEEVRARDKGRPLLQEELHREFSMVLLMGQDLVGTQQRKLVDDSKITASSWFLDRADHGKDQMWRSRLDWEDGPCWVGDPKDDSPYIQWEFPGMRTVTAVATKGRPDTASWVEKFRISYSEYRSEDKVPAGKEEEEWKRYEDEELYTEDILLNKKTGRESKAGLDNVERVKVYDLDGNQDQHTQKDNMLTIPFSAVRVRIHPMGWGNFRCPAMRAAIFGHMNPIPSSPNLEESASPGGIQGTTEPQPSLSEHGG